MGASAVRACVYALVRLDVVLQAASVTWHARGVAGSEGEV